MMMIFCCRYKLFERKIKILVDLKDKDAAFDARSDLILAVQESTLDEEKKCKIENEMQALLEDLENDTTKTANPGKKIDNKIVKPTLDKSHSYLPSLSVNVDIEFDPSRGRFAVANK